MACDKENMENSTSIEVLNAYTQKNKKQKL